MSRRIKRSTFLKGAAGLALAAVSGKLLYDQFKPPTPIPCRMLGPSMELGHMLRDGNAPHTQPNTALESSKVTIIGGGVAGLSAAWWLKRHGFSDFTLLELEKEVGGNSSSGQNDISRYPWGAHYVPLANEESEYVKLLFQELGVIQKIAENGLPVYNELYLCHDPEERLFKDGSFQEGLVPKRGLRHQDKKEVERFFQIVQEFREKRGKDSKRAFAIPVDLSSQDPEFLALDKISMSQFLSKNGFKSKPLLWYVNYCCRDDYGGTADSVSAWAGLHYFSGRNGLAANAEMNSVVTWPAGNGFLVEKLREQLKDQIKTGCLVSQIRNEDDAVVTTYIDVQSKETKGVTSECAICATPRFVAHRLIGETQRPEEYARVAQRGSAGIPPASKDLTYAPWLVANISIRRIPEARGVELAWDNVNYSSKSLGYVVATHQNITTQKEHPTVITYYLPLTDGQPADDRKRLTLVTPEKWSEFIIEDLEKMHRGIRKEIISMDLWPWGHGMIRPTVGFIWGETRKKMRENVGNVFFAHSDMSGISNFEEAQYQGVEAAKKVLTLKATST